MNGRKKLQLLGSVPTFVMHRMGGARVSGRKVARGSPWYLKGTSAVGMCMRVCTQRTKQCKSNS